jgi:hypothetical protein
MGLTGAAVSYIGGRMFKKKEDSPEKRAEEIALRIALEPFNTVPFLGSALEKGLTGGKVNMRTSPELGVLEDVVKRIGELAHSAKSSGSSSSADVLWKAIEGITAVAGPAGQAHRTFGYASKLQSGEAQPRGPLDVAGGLIYGDRETANPLTDAQDLLH